MELDGETFFNAKTTPCSAETPEQACLAALLLLTPSFAAMSLTFEPAAAMSLLLPGVLELFKGLWRTIGWLCRSSFLRLLLLNPVFNFSQLLLPLRGDDDKGVGLRKLNGGQVDSRANCAIEH